MYLQVVQKQGGCPVGAACCCEVLLGALCCFAEKYLLQQLQQLQHPAVVLDREVACCCHCTLPATVTCNRATICYQTPAAGKQ